MWRVRWESTGATRDGQSVPATTSGIVHPHVHQGIRSRMYPYRLKRRVGAALLLICVGVLLAGCLNVSQPRVTPEHRQLKNRAAVLVLVDPQPRVNRIALQPTQSTHGRARLAGWDADAAVRPYLAGRLQGMGMSVVPFTASAVDFAPVYASSQAYPNPALVRAAVRAQAVAQQVDMVVTVYRQVERDYVGESIENLVGYGLVQHEGGGANAFACVRVEAYDVASDAVIGYADGCRSAPLPPDSWQAAWNSDDEIPIDGAAAEPLSATLTTALQAAALTAAQEAGLSH